MCARIFAVADAFDAMTSDRVYRRGRSYAEAAQELDDWAGKQFDGEVVAAFRRVPQEDWDELRLRSLVKPKLSYLKLIEWTREEVIPVLADIDFVSAQFQSTSN